MICKDTKALKEEVKVVKEAEEGQEQLKEAMERQAAQIDECTKNQEKIKMSIRELEVA